MDKALNTCWGLFQWLVISPSCFILRFLCYVFIVCLFLAFNVSAGPNLIQYQGVLTNDASSPVSGDHSLTFRLFNEAVYCNQIWAETQSVSVASADSALTVADLAAHFRMLRHSPVVKLMLKPLLLTARDFPRTDSMWTSKRYQ